MANARESRAASEARVESAEARQEQLLHAILTDLDCEPSGLAALADHERDAPLPDAEKIGRKLDSLRQERERLGAVNLRADVELAEVEASRDRLIAERDDLTEAIKRLRTAIGSLNQEGRERLIAAFEIVNGHFQDLFQTLFEGGKAELQLIESDDPLEAGLELIAQPPGKKPQTLTLLSGGEQALTALSLIFAVFLTNPSPICVLDEVDAPLDDYNVERFCDLLDEMRKRSDTRFVTITHNPITMARMDRLFGVTMAERGREPDRVGGAGGGGAAAGGELKSGRSARHDGLGAKRDRLAGPLQSLGSNNPQPGRRDSVRFRRSAPEGGA